MGRNDIKKRGKQNLGEGNIIGAKLQGGIIYVNNIESGNTFSVVPHFWQFECSCLYHDLKAMMKLIAWGADFSGTLT